MSDVNQVMINIKKECQNPIPNTKRILKSLYGLRTNKKIQQPSDSEFFNIVGETYKLSPEFFMIWLYKPFMNKMGKVIGAEKHQEMEKYIIKKFCLAEDEQILYECKGNIKQLELIEPKIKDLFTHKFPVKISVLDGDLFFTNYRIIAHGLLNASGGYSESFWGSKFFGTDVLYPMRSKRAKKKTKKALIESTPVFGYQFSINTGFLINTGYNKNKLWYSIKIENRKWRITLRPSISSKREEGMDKIFNILSIVTPIDKPNKEFVPSKPEQDDNSIKFIKE